MVSRYFFVLLFTGLPVLANAQTPDWAFPMSDPSTPPELVDEVRDLDNELRAPAFEPAATAGMPDIVVSGKGDNVTRCGSCHLMTGLGQPQTAPLAGHRVAYFTQQMADFASGARTGYRPENMKRYAMGMNDADVRQVAEYYASLSYRRWIEVVETDTVPRTYIGGREIRARLPDGGTEPLGERIVELAKDPASPYQPGGPAYEAYVPFGSVARGEALVNTGGGKTVACGTCHGEDLSGNGDVPALAGRSPVYIARQIFQFRTGDRSGLASGEMKNLVADLEEGDIIAISAYLASLEPM